MRVGIFSSTHCLDFSVEGLLNDYPWIKDYNFIVNEHYDYDYVGTINIPNFDEVLEIMKKAQHSIIIHQPYNDVPMTLEIYDSYRE